MNTFYRRPYPLDKAHTCQSQTMSRSHFDRWKSWTLDSDAMGPLKKKRMRLRDESRKEKKLDKMAKSVWSAGNIHSSILTLPVHFFSSSSDQLKSIHLQQRCRKMSLKFFFFILAGRVRVQTIHLRSFRKGSREASVTH